MVRLVLWDIDGTLLHTSAVGIKAFAKALHMRFNVPNATEGFNFSGRTDTGVAREIFVKNQIETSKENFEHFFDYYIDWLAHMITEIRGEVLPGALKLIEEFCALPEPPVMGLLTGNIRLGAEIKLRHFDLWEHFATGAFADDHEDRNQIAVVAHQRGGQLLGKKLRGEETLVIGDTPLDIACGRAIGAKVLAVATGGSKLEELLKHKPDWAVKDLTHVKARELVYG
jgi:phosphoglycolate phosphatase-like HAD superfamily hydrolase